MPAERAGSSRSPAREVPPGLAPPLAALGGSAGVVERLRLAAAGLTPGEIAARTGLPEETVRRQLDTGRPAPSFLGAFCERFGVSPDWLLTGRGPRQYSAVGAHWLSRCPAAELLAELGRRVRARADDGGPAARPEPEPEHALRWPGGRVGGVGTAVSRPGRAAPRVPGSGPPDGPWPRLQRLPYLRSPTVPRARRGAEREGNRASG